MPVIPAGLSVYLVTLMATRWLAAILATALTGSTVIASENAGRMTATMDGPVEIAARNYRLQVYETFHADRTEFDGRLAKWTVLEAKWEQHGKPQRWQTELVRWLEEATARSRQDGIQPLPPEPLGVLVDTAPQFDPSPRDPLTLMPDDAASDGLIPDDPSEAAKPAVNAPVNTTVGSEPSAEQPSQPEPPAATVNAGMRLSPTNLLEGAGAWLDSVGDQIGHDVGNLLGAAAAPGSAKP